MLKFENHYSRSSGGLNRLHKYKILNSSAWPHSPYCVRAHNHFYYYRGAPGPQLYEVCVGSGCTPSLLVWWASGFLISAESRPCLFLLKMTVSRPRHPVPGKRLSLGQGNGKGQGGGSMPASPLLEEIKEVIWFRLDRRGSQNI